MEIPSLKYKHKTQTNNILFCILCQFMCKLLRYSILQFKQDKVSEKPNNSYCLFEAFKQLVDSFSTSDGSLYCLRLVGSGASIICRICTRGTQQISSLLGQLQVLEGPRGCMNVTCTSCSSSDVAQTLPIHHCWSYKHTTYLPETVSAREAVDFAAV